MKQLLLVFFLFGKFLSLSAQSDEEAIILLQGEEKTHPLGSDSVLWLFSEEDYKGVYIYKQDVRNSLRKAKVICCKVDTLFKIQKNTPGCDSLLKTVELMTYTDNGIGRIFLSSKPVARTKNPPKFVCDYIEIDTKYGIIPSDEDYPVDPKYLKEFDNYFKTTPLQGCYE
ncbi:TPA: hypothetical protein DEP21_03800 [Patescibacteria group bacterium]|nr:hypothetical protein [Candidatus Gracilibacteria bacterium]